MQYVNLGGSGAKVSRICLGTMNFGSKRWRSWMLEDAEARPLIKRALDLGINYFDTANLYSLGASETLLGRALKDIGPPRDRLVVATKVFYPMSEDPNHCGLSRKHIMQAIDDSLRRLGLDYVDLYQIHRFDPTTPMEETLEAMTGLIKAGKTRYIGASSMFAWQFAQYLALADRRGLARFVTIQSHYNLLYREEEREMIPLCCAEGVGLLPWSPLARGRLTGKEHSQTLRSKDDAYGRELYRGDFGDEAVIARLSEVAEKRGLSNTKVALAWLLRNPAVTAPLIGVERVEHLDEAVQALDVTLSNDEIKALEQPYRPHPVAGHV
jgi:aryl-alcohol dehydrogenase-like predicted oxidoreductase